MTNAPSVWPGLLCTDARATIRFLVEAFGFVETIVVPGEQEGEIMHAEVRWPEGGTVMIGSDDRRGEFADHNRPGTNSLYVVTDHPDEVFARATAARRPGRPADAGRGLRLARLHGPRSGGQPLELRHLPRRVTVHYCVATG